MNGNGNQARPEIALQGECVYNIDDFDGSMYMLDHRFEGCAAFNFTKKMDPKTGGKIYCNGVETSQKGKFINIAAFGGHQMLAIPFRCCLKEYDTVYKIRVEGFCDTDGLPMLPAEFEVRTLPEQKPDAAYGSHDSVALQAACEGIVLLQNDGTLPLESGSAAALCDADIFRLSAAGAGRINPRYFIGLRRGIEEYSSLKISDEADKCITVISRPSGENFDNNAVKGEYYLTDEEEHRLKTLAEKYSKLIVVVNTGYPIDVTAINKYADAVLWCGYAGMLGGAALAEILEGKTTPSGKLPDTWSADYYDIPSSRNFYLPENSEEPPSGDFPEYIDTVYEEGIYVGYRYFETLKKPVAYPFGYGLSYTDFDITPISAARKNYGAEFKISVKNTGKYSGKQTVQIYAEIPEGKLEQPSKRLVGFEKTSLLKPGECEELIIKVDRRDLCSFDPVSASYIIEKGTYRFFAGASVEDVKEIFSYRLRDTEIYRRSEHYMCSGTDINELKKGGDMPKGSSGKRQQPFHRAKRRSCPDNAPRFGDKSDIADTLTVEQLARLSVCVCDGWGMHETSAAGKLAAAEGVGLPQYIVADGNNGVNISKKNIGMPVSNMVAATWNRRLAYDIGRVIAEEARENGIDMILAPGMNIHRNPLCGRHPEYFSEDPLLAGTLAGYQSKGLEEHGVDSCLKHTVANSCETARKRNQSIIPERALREIYLKAFETAIAVHKPAAIMTAYNAVNGCFCAEDEELINFLMRREFGFDGFVMTDWNSYDTASVPRAVQSGNCWMTPGGTNSRFVNGIVTAVKNGEISEERLRSNVRYILHKVFAHIGKIGGCK